MAFFGFGSGGGYGNPFPGGPFGPGFGQFREKYRCFSMVFSTKTSEEITHGGKIIMPPSALEKLSRLNISYPMLFKLSSGNNDSCTHCGVLEFVAEEGRIYVPHWMINQLCIQDGDIIEVKNVSLQLATFSKFQPQTTDFLDITNPKAVLESKLRSFACLTKGDMIGIEYNAKIYELLVLETKPDNAVSIIECDMKVDFAAPVGYQPPEPEKMNTDGEDAAMDAERDGMIKEALEKTKKFQVFSGEGQRLDGKVKGKAKGSAGSSSPSQRSSSSGQQTAPPTAAEVPARGIPNYDYKKGKLTFARARTLNTNPEEPMEESQSSFTAFAGEGQKLKVKKNRNKDKRIE